MGVKSAISSRPASKQGPARRRTKGWREKPKYFIILFCLHVAHWSYLKVVKIRLCFQIGPPTIPNLTQCVNLSRTREGVKIGGNANDPRWSTNGIKILPTIDQRAPASHRSTYWDVKAIQPVTYWGRNASQDARLKGGEKDKQRNVEGRNCDLVKEERLCCCAKG